MNYKIKFLPLLLSVLLVNATGILLRYFDLDTYIILAGFRFHLSFVLPFLIIFRKDQLTFIKEKFINPQHKRTVLPLLWILLPVILITGILFYLQKINIGDPEYFYEFGLSSVFDYPVYLIWNSPQIIFLFLFLTLISTYSDKKAFTVSLITIIIFAFEFVPLKNKEINYTGILSLLFISISAGLLIKYFQNIYWFVIFTFSVFWLNFLIFGTNSDEIIHLLLAARYSGWEGFLETNKLLINYILPAQLFISLVTIGIASLHRRKMIKSSF